MTAAISWRPQSGTTRIPAWLHTPPDSLSRAPVLNMAPPSPASTPYQTPARVPVSPYWYRQEDSARGTFWFGLGRTVVSAGFNRRGRQPHLPSSCLPAHPAASPSPTRTKFPTCLSVSDSSRKYLAARAPAVLSPLRLLPCLPRGALQTQPGMGGGQSQEAWWAVWGGDGGGREQRQGGPVSIPKHHPQPPTLGY